MADSFAFQSQVNTPSADNTLKSKVSNALLSSRQLSSLNVDEVHCVLQSLKIDIPKTTLEHNNIDGELLSLAENVDELSELNIKLPSLKLKLLLKKILLMNEEGVPESILGKRQREDELLEDTSAAEDVHSETSKIETIVDDNTPLLPKIVSSMASTADNEVVCQCLYLKGIQCSAENNHEEAFRMYKLAADRGRVTAMVKVGDLYRSGTGVTKSDFNSQWYYKKAAETGNAEANFALADFIEYSNMSKDDAEYVIEHYRLASIKGHPIAHYRLARLYEGKNGVKKDLAKSFYHFSMSANLGYAPGNTALGRYYLAGKGTRKDKVLAMKHFRLAAKADVYAQFNLGVCYATEPHFDYAKSFDCFMKSANRNFAAGQYNVAVYYYEGKGVEVNKQQSYIYFKKAADQDDAKAKEKLATWFGDFHESSAHRLPDSSVYV